MRNAQLILETNVRPKDQTKYHLEVPFDMPDQVESVHVAIAVEAKEPDACVIDLGIRDTERVRGWSGGARTEFFVGKEKATPGYLAGSLQAGKWAVLLGAYRVPESGCTVRITVDYRLSSARWLKGDLHSHTVHSDGAYTLEEAVRIMEEAGCDFLATTDHNTVSQNFAHPKSTDLVLIPGMEWTSPRGHSNFLGISDPVNDFRCASMEELRACMHTAKAKGARVVLNHPHCDYCPWEWDWDVDYDYVEIWNGPWREANARTLAWWHEQLVAGRRIVALGGSDVHRPDRYVKHAMPTTWVYAEEKTADGIMRALDRGHVFITYSPDGPMIDLKINGSMTGDCAVVREGEPVKAELRLTQVKEGDSVRLLSEIGEEHVLQIQEDGRLETQYTINGRRFLRVEIWRWFTEVNQLLLAAMSNPVYMTSTHSGKEEPARWQR